MLNFLRKKQSIMPPADLITNNFEPPTPLQTAVLFLVFNRPDTTAQVFEAIRKAKPPWLYVAADGPRANREGEAEKVTKVREIATAVDWPCEVKTLFREENLGCKYAVSGGITWFFEHEEQGIILEDDCLPSQSFFWFCEHMLNIYKHNHVVMHIGGYKPKHIPIDEFSISFTRATHVWGWATWANRWEKYTADLSFNKKDELNLLANYEYFYVKKATKARVSILKKLLEGKIDTWDYQWNFWVRVNSGLAIRPCVNLVENIGHGHEAATHTSGKQKKHTTSEINLAKLILPRWILPNRDLEKAFEMGLATGFWHRLLARILRLTVLPDFLMVGAAKSGTTSLFHILQQDSSVFIPTMKECRFFSQMPRSFKGGEAARFQNEGPRYLNKYLELFDGKENYIKGDLSNDYFYYHEKSIQNIKMVYKNIGQDEPKIVIVLRNPVDRVFSMYNHIIRLGSDTKGFLDAFFSSEERIKSGYAWMFDLKGVGKSTIPVQSYISAFDDVKVFLFEDIFYSNGITELGDYLGLKSSSQLSVKVKENENSYNKSRSVFLNMQLIKFARLKSRLPFMHKQSYILKLAKFTHKKLLLLNRENSPIKLKDNEKKELLRYYRKDIDKLELLINRDLTIWKK